MTDEKTAAEPMIKKMAVENALFLPPGSVRALLALGAVGSTIWLMAKILDKCGGNLDGCSLKFPGWWVAIVTLVVRDFFAKPK